MVTPSPFGNSIEDSWADNCLPWGANTNPLLVPWMLVLLAVIVSWLSFSLWYDGFVCVWQSVVAFPYWLPFLPDRPHFSKATRYFPYFLVAAHHIPNPNRCCPTTTLNACSTNLNTNGTITT